MSEVEYKIRVEAKRIKGERDGKKYDFLSFEGFDKNGRKCRFKFTKDCNDVPEEEGEYIMTVDRAYINKDKQSRFNNYWVKEVISFEEYDGFTPNEDDLPF